ncbi:hypothetical protein EET67_04585 [Pseudaminobacter arsenicus]|uniref:Uncharacterized protein n=1 Tax=Borborobacter arsenicus TaxID=1851146 RepID=A0A432V9Y5_9HYPH|nr:hypothetical protein [Pseudaminobacter arsenicus]RUM98926.1 hypothetical protein EET67_04585 [Pseudaminobacter arsenicus]
MTLKLNYLLAASMAACVASVSVAKADNLVFTLKNGTNSVLTEFYASPANVEQWEEDILGRDVLNPGETAQVTIADGRRVCKYDLRFEFSEDSDLDTTTDTQNLCEMESYTIEE